MKQENEKRVVVAENVSASGATKLVYDAGKFTMYIQWPRIVELMQADADLCRAVAEVAQATLIHRRADGGRLDAAEAEGDTDGVKGTQWFLDRVRATGRGGVRVSKNDRAKAAVALEKYKENPEGVKAAFEAKYGREFITDADMLAGFYAEERGKEKQDWI